MEELAMKMEDYYKNPSPLVRCVPIYDKRQSDFLIRIENGDKMIKKFSDFEKLFITLRHAGLIPTAASPPPKRKFLQAELKLTEKRKIWIESFAQKIISSLSQNDVVQRFFELNKYDDDNEMINLGSSEMKSVKPSDFDFLKTVGKGSFGKVYLAKHRLSQKIFAVKVMSKENIKLRNEVKHIMAERNVLISNVNHPFLVALHYSFQTKDKLYFVLDYLNGGELFFHLQKEKRFSESRSRFYAAEIASALGHLHKNHIIYRDLKPENLLLDRDGHVVLTDFGLCKENIKPTDTTETFCGTPEYLAPEIVLKQPYDQTVDWWCLGSVLYEMLIGLPPFYCKDRNEMYDKILNQKLRITLTLSTSCKNILTRLLDKDNTSRLGALNDFVEVRNHLFFEQINFEKLEKKEIKPPYVPHINGEMDLSLIDREFTSQKPNTESLIPSKSYGTQRDNDFQGFSFAA